MKEYCCLVFISTENSKSSALVLYIRHKQPQNDCYVHPYLGYVLLFSVPFFLILQERLKNAEMLKGDTDIGRLRKNEQLLKEEIAR